MTMSEKKSTKQNDRLSLRDIMPRRVMTSVGTGNGSNAGMPIFDSRRQQYRVSTLDLLNMAESGYKAEEMIDILIDCHPDVSHAVWACTTLTNTGLALLARNEQGKRSQHHEKWLSGFVNRMTHGSPGRYYEDHSLNSLVDVTTLSLFVRGAACSEVVVNGRCEPLYVWPRESGYVDFQSDNKTGRHVPYWKPPGAMTEGTKIDNDRFFYQVLGHRIDDPYGVSPILSVLSIVYFQLKLLVDLAQIVNKVGFPRPDITVDEKAMIELAKQRAGTAFSLTEIKDFIDDYMSIVKSDYATLNPEDPLFHLDSVKVSYLESKSGAQVFDVRSLMYLIGQQICSAMKTLPSLMGRSEGKTETFASAEVALYKAQIRRIQNTQEAYFTRIFTRCMNMAGLRGTVKAQFGPLELRSDTEIEQWESTRIVNLCRKALLRVLSLDELRQKLRRETGALPELTDINEEELWKKVEMISNVKPLQAERSGESTADRDSKNKTGSNGAGVPYGRLEHILSSLRG